MSAPSLSQIIEYKGKKYWIVNVPDFIPLKEIQEVLEETKTLDKQTKLTLTSLSDNQIWVPYKDDSNPEKELKKIFSELIFRINAVEKHKSTKRPYSEEQEGKLFEANFDFNNRIAFYLRHTRRKEDIKIIKLKSMISTDRYIQFYAPNTAYSSNIETLAESTTLTKDTNLCIMSLYCNPLVIKYNSDDYSISSIKKFADSYVGKLLKELISKREDIIKNKSVSNARNKIRLLSLVNELKKAEEDLQFKIRLLEIRRLSNKSKFI